MVTESAAAVTTTFVDTAVSVSKSMLSNPVIAECMRDLDDTSAYGAGDRKEGTGANNAFDSHTRLWAILGKCKAAQPAALQWCMETIWYMTKKGLFSKVLSASDVKGSTNTGNRGMIDLFLYKKEVRRIMLTKGCELFGEEGAD